MTKLMEQLLLMFCTLKKKKIYPAYVSSYSLNHKKQVILLIIPNGKKRHYLPVKKLLTLTRGIISKNNADFY